MFPNRLDSTQRSYSLDLRLRKQERYGQASSNRVAPPPPPEFTSDAVRTTLFSAGERASTYSDTSSGYFSSTAEDNETHGTMDPSPKKRKATEGESLNRESRSWQPSQEQFYRPESQRVPVSGYGVPVEQFARLSVGKVEKRPVLSESTRNFKAQAEQGFWDDFQGKSERALEAYDKQHPKNEWIPVHERHIAKAVAYENCGLTKARKKYERDETYYNRGYALHELPTDGRPRSPWNDEKWREHGAYDGGTPGRNNRWNYPRLRGPDLPRNETQMTGSSQYVNREDPNYREDPRYGPPVQQQSPYNASSMSARQRNQSGQRVQRSQYSEPSRVYPSPAVPSGPVTTQGWSTGLPSQRQPMEDLPDPGRFIAETIRKKQY